MLINQFLYYQNNSATSPKYGNPPNLEVLPTPKAGFEHDFWYDPEYFYIEPTGPDGISIVGGELALANVNLQQFVHSGEPGEYCIDTGHGYDCNHYYVCDVNNTLRVRSS